MDLVVSACDSLVLTPYVYPATWTEDWWVRQTLTLCVLVNSSAYVLYLICATLNYYFVFDHRLMTHKRFLKDQIRREILYTFWSIPYMTLLTIPVFLGEIRGHSKLYDNVDEWGYGFLVFSVFSFLFFTDMCIYWIHRWLHIPILYKHIHKPHHYWKIPSPFASHAFHPVDGFLQSTPYHIYAYCFPLHKVLYLVLFVFVNVWTVSIHDGSFNVPAVLKPFINGAAHHTDHHLYYYHNYGQYFTLWDRLGGSFRNPTSFEGKGPHDVPSDFLTEAQVAAREEIPDEDQPSLQKKTS